MSLPEINTAEAARDTSFGETTRFLQAFATDDDIQEAFLCYLKRIITTPDYTSVTSGQSLIWGAIPKYRTLFGHDVPSWLRNNSDCHSRSLSTWQMPGDIIHSHVALRLTHAAMHFGIELPTDINQIAELTEARDRRSFFLLIKRIFQLPVFPKDDGMYVYAKNKIDIHDWQRNNRFVDSEDENWEGGLGDSHQVSIASILTTVTKMLELDLPASIKEILAIEEDE